MFFAHCPTWNTTVMLSASSIVAVRNAADGPQAVLRCHCGEHLTTVAFSHAAVTPAA